MTTEADLAGLVANANNADTCPFVFTEAAHAQSTDALAALGGAIAEVNERALVYFRPDVELDAQPPHLSPAGPASLFLGGDMAEDEEIAQWFMMLATALTEMGWSGALRPLRWEEHPECRPAAIWLSVTLCLDGWDPRADPGPVPFWSADRGFFPELLDLAMEWTGAVDGDLWLSDRYSVRGEEPDVRRALAARLDTPGGAKAELHRQGASAERRVGFSSYGHMTLQERSDSTLDVRLAALRSASLRWPSRLARSYTTSAMGGHSIGQVDSRPGDRKVPNAYVEQVLTGEHLELAHDLSSWHVEEVAAGRYLVAHPHPSDWFLPTPPDRLPRPDSPPETYVDRQTLLQAREDFGAMILRHSDL